MLFVLEHRILTIQILDICSFLIYNLAKGEIQHDYQGSQLFETVLRSR